MPQMTSVMIHVFPSLEHSTDCVHKPGVFKRGKDTEWDANCGMEEIREFCFKEFAVACLFWNFFVLYYSNNITYHPKEVYAYRGSPIKNSGRLLRIRRSYSL